jgi:hypothetical protein
MAYRRNYFSPLTGLGDWNSFAWRSFRAFFWGKGLICRNPTATGGWTFFFNTRHGCDWQKDRGIDRWVLTGVLIGQLYCRGLYHFASCVSNLTRIQWKPILTFAIGSIVNITIKGDTCLPLHPNRLGALCLSPLVIFSGRKLDRCCNNEVGAT